MDSRTITIESPCHESWDAMAGEGPRRFCGVCQKDVHDLSAMRHDEANALLRGREGASLCVRYTAEADGTLRFRDLVPRASLTRKLVRTALAAAALAACTPHGEGPARGLGDAFIESIRASTVATPDGGCDYTTGPFTTFHLPAGHPLCRGDGVAVIDELPRVLGGIGERPAPPAEPAPAEVAREEMGQAIARPEPAPELVPCDAPAVDEQPEPPQRKMGVMKRPPDPPRKAKMGKPKLRADD